MSATFQYNDIRRQSQRIDFTASRNENGAVETDSFYFEFNFDNNPSDTALAVTLASFIGSSFDEVYYDLVLPTAIIDALKAYHKAEVKTKGILDEAGRPQGRTAANNICLNFSGGLDSFAAKLLLPENITKLVSIDFLGGLGKREYGFFKDFNPYIVHTDIRQKPLFEKLLQVNHVFMFLGCGLYCDLLQSSLMTFGTILEADRYFNGGILQAQNLPYSLLGFSDFCPTFGLTEIGTCKIVGAYAKDKVAASLESLAHVGHPKRLRKDVIAHYMVDSAIVVNKCNPIPFGKDYTADFLALYFVRHFGLAAASKMVGGIPDEIVRLVRRLNCDFYVRFNPLALIGFRDRALLQYVVSRLFEAGIEFYTPTDFEELSLICAAMSRVYNQKDLHINVVPKNYYI